MIDDTDAPQGGAGGADASAVVDNAAPAVIADDTAAQPDAGADNPAPAADAGADNGADDGDQPPKKVPWFQKRIDEVTARKYEAEREAAYWRGIAQGHTPSTQPAPQHEEPAPEPFDPGYNDWVIEQAAARVAQQQREQSALRSYEERAAVARAAKPDFDSVVHDQTLPITSTMAELIRESESGPDVAYYLGTNRPEAERISRLPPLRQAAELGRIEASLTKASPASKPIPPAPPQTVGGVSSGLTKTMEQMSYAEFKKMRDAEDKNRNR